MQPKVQTQTLPLQWLRAALICRYYEFVDDYCEYVDTSAHTSLVGFSRQESNM
jgi:hypothetical protein